jgi:CRP-like cAMP-binding protein
MKRRSFAASLPYAWTAKRGSRVTNARATNFQDLLLVVRTGTNRLEHLTENDWALIIDKSERKMFAQGDPIFEHGTQNPHIFIIAKGKASILSARGWQIASVGPGEILGEMAFLESSQASAHVKAATAVEAFALSWSALQILFGLYPHLASRFYRSIAVSLSRRLRSQISD